MIEHLTPHFWVTAAFMILLAFAGGCCVGATWAARNTWTEGEGSSGYLRQADEEEDE